MRQSRWYHPTWRDGPSCHVETTRPWYLPGIRCSICKNSYALLGRVLPHVRFDSEIGALLKARQVDYLDFIRLRDHVARSYPAIMAEKPGTGFGPARGECPTQLLDFLWSNDGSLLVLQETFDALCRSGLSLAPPVATEIRRGPKWSDLLELVPSDWITLHPSSYRSDYYFGCSTCGYENRILSKHRLALPADRHLGDLCQLTDLGRFQVVSERFVAVVQSLELRGATFTEVEVMPPEEGGLAPRPEPSN